jgi:hypothetical protein
MHVSVTRMILKQDTQFHYGETFIPGIKSRQAVARQRYRDEIDD